MKKKIVLILVLALVMGITAPISVSAANELPVPEFNLSDPNGVYKIFKPESITLTCDDFMSGFIGVPAKIYYTTNGTTPTNASALYQGFPIVISETKTIKAIAYFQTSKSEVVSMKYEYVDTTPKAVPAGGTYSAKQTVALTTAITGSPAKIYYTTDGSDPTNSGTKKLYSAPISISSNTTLKAAAYWGTEAVYAKAVMTETYSFNKYVLPDANFNAFPPAMTAADVTLGDDVVVKISDTSKKYAEKINDIAIDDVLVPGFFESECVVGDNTLIIDSSAFQTEGDHKITVKAAGYFDQTCTVKVKAKAGETPVVPETAPDDGKDLVGDMKNFLIKNTYKRGQFTDVDEAQWFGFDKQKVIASAFEYGLMKGDSATTFNPSGNITVAEAITMAARVHSIYVTGADNFAQGSPWYQVYVDYALKNGVVGENEFTNLTRPATRAEMAAIFSGSLHSLEFMAKNTVKKIPDVNESYGYGVEIYMLYRAGVLTGSDTSGTFKPESNITRAEAAAIISRVALPESRASGKIFE